MAQKSLQEILGKIEKAEIDLKILNEKIKDQELKLLLFYASMQGMSNRWAQTPGEREMTSDPIRFNQLLSKLAILTAPKD